MLRYRSRVPVVFIERPVIYEVVAPRSGADRDARELLMTPISRNEKITEQDCNTIVADAIIARDDVLVNYKGLIMRNRFHVIKWNELEHALKCLQYDTLSFVHVGEFSIFFLTSYEFFILLQI